VLYIIYMKATVTIFPLAGGQIWNPDMAIEKVSHVYLKMPCGAQFLMQKPVDYPGRGKGSWAPQDRLQATFTVYPRFPHWHRRHNALPNLNEENCSFVQTIGQYQVLVECLRQVQ
jgi:hypothetical protein